MEMVGPAPAWQELQRWFERERETNGLVEMAFCPGSDREVGVDEAAKVALAMIRYVKG